MILRSSAWGTLLRSMPRQTRIEFFESGGSSGDVPGADDGDRRVFLATLAGAAQWERGL